MKDRRKRATAASSNNSTAAKQKIVLEKKRNRQTTNKNDKDIRVGISIIMNSKMVGTQKIDYSCDLDRFKLTYEIVKSSGSELPKHKKTWYKELMRVFESNESVDEYFFSIGIQYLVSHQVVEDTLKQFPSKPLGFAVDVDPFDYDSAMVACVDYDTWDKVRRMMAA